jgi:phage terminase large subunit-like protein
VQRARREGADVIASTDPGFELRYQARYAAARARSATLAGPSLAERLAALPAAARAYVFDSLSVGEKASLLYSWDFWARPKQRVSADVEHLVWLLTSGRRFGKSRAAAERARERVYAGDRRLLFVAPTLGEARRFMVSAFLETFPPSERAQIVYLEEKGEIRCNFVSPPAIVEIDSDEKGGELRGGGYSFAWLDEVGKFRHLEKLWANLEYSMSVKGSKPEIIVTTTPRPMRFLKELIVDEGTVTTLGISDENASNLADSYIQRLEARFGDSRLAAQERRGELLSEIEGAMFFGHIIDATRVAPGDVPALVRVVVAVDPAISEREGNDPTSCVAAGIDARGHVYILGETTGHMSPEAWGAAAIRLFDLHSADSFVGERNRGGDLVASNIRARWAESRASRHSVAPIEEVLATRGKSIRAEPVSTMHEMGKLHVVGSLPSLEQEICDWSPAHGGPSPNRLDAMVWACYSLAKLGVPEVERWNPFFGISKMVIPPGPQRTVDDRPPVGQGRARAAPSLMVPVSGGGWGNNAMGGGGSLYRGGGSFGGGSGI